MCAKLNSKTKHKKYIRYINCMFTFYKLCLSKFYIHISVDYFFQAHAIYIWCRNYMLIILVWHGVIGWLFSADLLVTWHVVNGLLFWAHLPEVWHIVIGRLFLAHLSEVWHVEIVWLFLANWQHHWMIKNQADRMCICVLTF